MPDKQFCIISGKENGARFDFRAQEEKNQGPFSFGRERDEAEKAGATFKWPFFTGEITEEGVVSQSGEDLGGSACEYVADAPRRGGFGAWCPRRG